MADARTRLRSFAALAALPWLAGCVTVAEFRKLERRVNGVERAGAGDTGGTGRVADIGQQIEELREQVQRLEGRLDVAEHEARRALEDARAAREEAARAGGAAPPAPGEPPPGEPPGAGGAPPPSSSAELTAYREAYSAWRAGDAQLCIDRFRNFLQTYPSSAHADDAAYWMADCYFKHGDYKTAVLRFDDVVTRHPTSGKAPDALYRQGEALLRLGPGFSKAAGKAFERVVKEYPDSARAAEARKQLELLRSG
jgi:tol-pal system protein YbgF